MDNFLNNFAAFNAEVERDQFALEEARRNNEILRNEISEMKVEIARHQNEETETKKKTDITAFHSNEIGQTVTKILSDLKTLASKVEEIEKESIRQKKMEPEVRSKLADIRQKISNIELIDKDLHEEIKNISQIKQIKPEILSDMKSRKSHIFKELSSSADAFDLTELVSEIIIIDEKRRTKFQLQQENIEQFDTISRIDKINESFREKLDVISDRRARIQREKDEVIALNEHLLSRLKEAKDISSTLKSQLQALEVRLLEIQSSNSAKEKRIAELTEVCDLKRNILIERQQRLSDLRVQLVQEKESLERMRNDMESEKQRIKDDHELRMREIQSRKDEYSKTVHEADCEIKKHMECERLRGIFESKRKTIDRTSKISTLTEKRAVLQLKIEEKARKLEIQMAKFEALRIEGDAKKQVAEKDLAEKQSLVDDCIRKKEMVDMELMEIKKKIEEREEEVKQARLNRDCKREELEAIKKEFRIRQEKEDRLAEEEAGRRERRLKQTRIKEEKRRFEKEKKLKERLEKEKSEKERLEQIRERARAEKLRVARERSIKERERRENEREKHLLDEQLKLIEERAKERKMSIPKKHENPDKVRVQQNTQEVKNIVINAVQKRSQVLDDLNCTALCEELQGDLDDSVMSDDEGDIDCQYMNSQKSISKAPSPHRRLSAAIPVKAMSNTSIQFEPNELITSTPLIEKRARPTRNKSGLRAETNVILKVPPRRQLSGGRGGRRRGKKK